MSCITPQWPAPHLVNALVSTREGGVSQKPFHSLNLGDHVGDKPADVLANRAIFAKHLPAEPIWLRQIHGTAVSTPQSRQANPALQTPADAAVSNIPGEVLVIMTADCLPVLFTNTAGTVIGAAHAGWRGLCAGVLEKTVAELLNISNNQNPSDVIAWLGPAIGSEAFEVGQDVVTAFKDSGVPVPVNAFKAINHQPGKFLANIYELARGRLEAYGVKMIFGGQYCTVRDQEQFFSYRRDGVTGRFASAIWLSK